MDLRLVALALCFPAVVVLPFAVHRTNHSFDRPASLDFWLGVVDVFVAIAVLECGFRFVGDLWAEEVRKRPPGKPVPPPDPVNLLRWAALAELQLVTVLMYATTMDAGVRFSAARHVYLVYAVTSLGLVCCRWRVWSYPERFYLRWGWAPVLAFGVPSLLPWLRSAGLVRGPLG
jgi:hypothetical protein